MLCNDGVVLCVPRVQYPLLLCDPTVPELGADWVGAPLGHTAHPHQRLLGGEEDNVECGAQADVAGERGRGGWRVRGWTEGQVMEGN